jgi:hypothetical protein
MAAAKRYETVAAHGRTCLSALRPTAVRTAVVVGLAFLLYEPTGYGATKPV